MKIAEYFSCPQKDKFLKQIESYEWSAAKYLASLLKENNLEKVLGGWARLFLLIDGDSLVSFITLSAQDCIKEPAFTPWLGFFHTAPEYRGHRYGKIVMDYALQVAKESGYKTIYVATDHDNLYEKYGFVYLENRIDVWGEDSKVYIKQI